MQTEFFFFCPICGNVVVRLVSSGTKLSCCGKEMQLLTANTSDGAADKHVPVIEWDHCNKTLRVVVGTDLHPHVDFHHIDFIYVQTAHGGLLRRFNPTDEPIATFSGVQEPQTAYAYCNLHGLWSSPIDDVVS